MNRVARARQVAYLLVALLVAGTTVVPATTARGMVGEALPVAARGLSQSGAATTPPPRDGAGYFGVEQRGERWWLTTPAGDPFFSVGVDYVGPGGIPAADGTNPYRDVMEAKYGKPVNQAAWAADAGGRLIAWGFNTVGAYSSGARGALGGLPDTPQLFPLHVGVIPAIRAATGAREAYPIVVVDPADRYDFHRLFVDVYHPLFEQEVGKYFAAQLPARATDPTLIGYFLDNELPFWYRPTGQGRGGATLADTYIALGPDAAGKRAWVELLRGRYGGDIGALNAAWGAGHGSFDELLAVAAVPGGTAAQRADKSAFLEALADRYFGTLATLFRRYDPHHLILGCRFVAIDTVPSGFGIETPPEVLRAAGRHQDVASINYYIFGGEPADQRRQRMRTRYAEFAAATGRPILNGEFSFAARDSGMPNTHALGEVVATQEERAARYADFARFTAEIPEAVGLHWWAYLDPPRQGSANGGEDGNQGLVNNDDVPYAALTGLMATLNPQLAGIHAASTGATLPPGSPSPPPAGPPAGATCFAETGKCVAPDFLAYWTLHGGLAINGFPLSDEFVETLEDGKPYTVQYFERVRMERHPGNPPPYDILLGQFGRRIHPADPPVAAIPGATYFAETGHNVTRPEFAAYWRANGGLAQFGFPLTEEFTERLEDGVEYRVQYFERARFEWHPENSPPYNVLLGQFGRRIYGMR